MFSRELVLINVIYLFGPGQRKAHTHVNRRTIRSVSDQPGYCGLGSVREWVLQKVKLLVKVEKVHIKCADIGDILER